MRRLFWLAMGITMGIIVMRRLQQTAGKMRPDALAQRAGRSAADAGHQAKSFFADVRDAMREREAELRESAGLDSDPGAGRVLDSEAVDPRVDPNTFHPRTHR